MTSACYEKLLRTLLQYLRISGMPFKSMVVRLLIKLMSVRQETQALPDLT